MVHPASEPKRSSSLFRTTILALALTALPPLASSGAALEPAIVKGLRELDLGARLEQRCDLEAMTRIAKDKKGYVPERVVASATADAKIEGDSLQGDGAAFRSKGNWYYLTYVCKTSNDHMDVLDFNYKIGAAIPKDKWDQYGLWD